MKNDGYGGNDAIFLRLYILICETVYVYFIVIHVFMNLNFFEIDSLDLELNNRIKSVRKSEKVNAFMKSMV